MQTFRILPQTIPLRKMLKYGIMANTDKMIEDAS